MKLIQMAWVCGACISLLGACSSDETSGAAGGAGAPGAGGSAGFPGTGGTAGVAGQAGAAGGMPDGGLPEGGEDAQPEGGTKLTATIETSKGTIVLELYSDQAPITVENFKKYADDKFYDGLIFHRVIPNFVIQGGGLDEAMVEKTPTYAPIVNESKTSGLSNLAGTIAMARTSDPNSATCQFYINVKDNLGLDPGGSPQNPDGYAVFGKVTQGMDVVNTIKDVPTETVGIYEDVPIDPVLINSIVVK